MPSDDLALSREPVPPRPPGGWGVLSSWADELGLDVYCVTFVRGIDERDALLRLGAPAETIRPMTFEQATDLAVDGWHTDSACATASRVGDWTVLVEQNGAEGVGAGVVSGEKAIAALSAGTVMVSTSFNINGWGLFVYARDGLTLASFDLDETPDTDNMDGEDPEALVPYLERIGTDRFNFEDDDDDSDPTLELAALVAGVLLSPEDFGGELLGAHWWK